MDPWVVWQAAMDTLPLLVLRTVALILIGMAMALTVCIIGAVACHRVGREQA